MISCQVCWRTMRWHNGQIRRSQNPHPEEVFQDCITKWEESVAHSILARSTFHSNQGRIHLRRPTLSLSFFACNSAADHTFRMADNQTESTFNATALSVR